jgi:homoaconitase/3-isopropylmalate dehydratase large subunit
MGKPCPGCGSREPIDMHSCRAEKVLRKQRQEFRFDWDAVVPSSRSVVKPLKSKGILPAQKPKVGIPYSCGKCGACLRMIPELCEDAIKRLME